MRYSHRPVRILRQVRVHLEACVMVGGWLTRMPVLLLPRNQCTGRIILTE